MLTELEKTANKAAKKVRDAAYRRRRSGYWNAMKAADESPAVREASARVEECAIAYEVALDARREREREFRKQIAALEEQIKALAGDPTVDQASAEQSRAVDERNAIKERLHAAIGLEFPDMQGSAQWSAAAWKAPQNVLDEMEAARQAVLSSGQAEAAESTEE